MLVDYRQRDGREQSASSEQPRLPRNACGAHLVKGGPHRSEKLQLGSLVGVLVLLAVDEAANVANSEGAVCLLLRTGALERVVVTPVWHRVLLDGVNALLRHLVHDGNVLVAASEFNQNVARHWHVPRPVTVEGQLLVVDAIGTHPVDVVKAAPTLLGVQPTRKFGALA